MDDHSNYSNGYNSYKNSYYGDKDRRIDGRGQYYSRRDGYDPYDYQRYSDRNVNDRRDWNGYDHYHSSNYERMSDLDYISSSDQYKRRFRSEPRSYHTSNDQSYSKHNKGRHAPADPSNTIGIFGFGHYTTEEDVRKILQNKIPHIKGYNYKLIIDERTGFCRGFCFVDFKCLEDAVNAKNILSFESFRGLDLKCDFSYKQKIIF